MLLRHGFFFILHLSLLLCPQLEGPPLFQQELLPTDLLSTGSTIFRYPGDFRTHLAMRHWESIQRSISHQLWECGLSHNECTRLGMSLSSHIFIVCIRSYNKYNIQDGQCSGSSLESGVSYMMLCRWVSARIALTEESLIQNTFYTLHRYINMIRLISADQKVSNQQHTHQLPQRGCCMSIAATPGLLSYNGQLYDIEQ